MARGRFRSRGSCCCSIEAKAQFRSTTRVAGWARLRPRSETPAMSNRCLHNFSPGGSLARAISLWSGVRVEQRMTGKVTDSLPAGTLINGPDITPGELQLAVRNHSMPLEALRYEITPIGLHYLLIHFDIPAVDPNEWALTVGGHVRHPLQLSLEQIKARPSTTLAVTLECAGNGRARLSPRPLSQPWLTEAVGTAEWTGTRLGPLLDEAGLIGQGGDVVFTGFDRGIQGDVEQQYERSLPLAECRREEILLAYAINGQPLPPQHGFPLRLIVPGWYTGFQVAGALCGPVAPGAFGSRLVWLRAGYEGRSQRGRRPVLG